MARRAHKPVDDEEGWDNPMLGRFLLWAGLAAVALGSVALAAQSQTGAQRLALFLGRGGAGAKSPGLIANRPSDAELETRRLADAVRNLAADRDRLQARLDALERNIDVTASVPRDNSPASSPAPASAPGAASSPSNGAAAAQFPSLAPNNPAPAG